MLSDRALEIIAAYGADERRWPADERDAVRRLAATDPTVRAMLAEARALDTAIAQWLAHPVTGAGVDDDLAAHRALAQAKAEATRAAPARRWLLRGGGLAAMLALGAVLALNSPQPATRSDAVAVAEVADPPAALSEEEALFSLMFTPTLEEEML